jgi:hypothetical protein
VIVLPHPKRFSYVRVSFVQADSAIGQRSGTVPLPTILESARNVRNGVENVGASGTLNEAQLRGGFFNPRITLTLRTKPVQKDVHFNFVVGPLVTWDRDTDPIRPATYHIASTRSPFRNDVVVVKTGSHSCDVGCEAAHRGRNRRY